MQNFGRENFKNSTSIHQNYFSNIKVLRYRVCVQEVLVISPDKPGGPKGHLTNTGVNIRPIPSIWCPPWAPLSQS